MRRSDRLFTIVAEFRGSTAVSQTRAVDKQEAARLWLVYLHQERPFGRASLHLYRSLQAKAGGIDLTALAGLKNIWCFVETCGGDLMLANIVETVDDA